MKSEEAVDPLRLPLLLAFHFFNMCGDDLISIITTWGDLACLRNPFRYVTGVVQYGEHTFSKCNVLFCFEKSYILIFLVNCSESFCYLKK